MRADFRFRGGREASRSLIKVLGVRGMCLLRVRSTPALPSSAGTHIVSSKNCVRVETGQWLNRSGAETAPSRLPSTLGSDVYCRWLINAQARWKGIAVCLRPAMGKRKGLAAASPQMGVGECPWLTAFLGVPRVSLPSAEKSPDPPSPPARRGPYLAGGRSLGGRLQRRHSGCSGGLG